MFAVMEGRNDESKWLDTNKVINTQVFRNASYYDVCRMYELLISILNECFPV